MLGVDLDPGPDQEVQQPVPVVPVTNNSASVTATGRDEEVDLLELDDNIQISSAGSESQVERILHQMSSTINAQPSSSSTPTPGSLHLGLDLPSSPTKCQYPPKMSEAKHRSNFMDPL